MNMNDEQRSAVATELEQVSIEAYNVPREDLRATTFVGRQEASRNGPKLGFSPFTPRPVLQSLLQTLPRIFRRLIPSLRRKPS